MSILSGLKNMFGRSEKDLPQGGDSQVEEKSQDSLVDFGLAMPGISDGRLYYFYLDGLNKAFSTNYIINKCVNILAYNLSRLPMRFSKNGEMLPIDYTIKGFDINNPHPRMSLSKLLYECGVYYWYKGEFMVFVDEEAPFSLEPINPEHMKIAANEGRIITQWKFGRDTIDESQLIYVPMMNPDLNVSFGGKISDSSRTLSLVTVIQKEIANYASGRDFNTQFFENFAQLGLTLTDVDGRTTKDDRQAIANQIDNKLGRKNAWRTRVLPQGLSVADTKSLSMREMEFSQSMKDIRDIALGVYGVPRSVFGITNEAGLAQSTVDVEKRIMWTDNIKPVAYMIQEAFNQILSKRYFPGYKLVFDYSVIDVLQDDLLEKTDLALKYQSLGYTTEEINEKLKLEMPESTDTRMNERFHPNSLLPYSEFEALTIEPTKEIDSNSISIKSNNTTTTKSVRAQRYKRRFNTTQKRVEKNMVSKIGLYFAKQLGKVLGLIKDSNKTVKDVNETILLTEILDLLSKEKETLGLIMEPIYSDASLKGSNLALTVLNSDSNPMVSEKIVTDLTNEIKGINNYTYKLIKTQVQESLLAGESIDDLTKRVQKVYKFNKSRAKTIARTESLKVLSRTTDKEYRDAGVTKKQWLGGHRPTHVDNASKGIVDYDYVYNGGLRFPGDAGPASEVINCTCSMCPVVE